MLRGKVLHLGFEMFINLGVTLSRGIQPPSGHFTDFL